MVLFAIISHATKDDETFEELEEEEREEEEEDETPKGIRKDQNSDVDLDGANESEAKCPLVDFCTREDEMLYAAATVTGNVEALQCNYCEKRWSAFACLLTRCYGA